MRACMLPTTAGRPGQAYLTARPLAMCQRLTAARQQLTAGALWRAGPGGSRRPTTLAAAAAGGDDAEPSSSNNPASTSNESTTSGSRSNGSTPGSSGRGSKEPVPMRSLLEASSSSSPPPDEDPQQPAREGRGMGARLQRAAAAVLRMLRSPLALRRLLTIAFMFTLGSVLSLASSRGRSANAPQEVGPCSALGRGS